ncbi:MAG: guanylate kinase [Pseudomonadales bacterium]|jgi:protein-S-isoprenylcysteine O-methyltransferase Ste14|nr:guanylate kinase [Pseudomonadales bacterium]TNC89900.1 MAG: guanylate kinase [Alcanivorax sp.]HAG96298.1 guanylate kinase [Gammaproteobacteria bacterium]MAQ24631.1 guanylate kinase [Pseudomonadales bacterium]HAU14356.1 guanylate kinase [Gammaproteobacteria bacterium]|tara:strand:+ start:23494 stop:24156 length:663 start_codon:yes stop_codon:yes gene_type:complete
MSETGTRDFRNKVPLYTMLSAIVLFTHFATLKLQHWDGIMWLVGLATGLGYIIWLMSEANVSITEQEKGATQKDRGTCELYVFGRILTVFSAIILDTQWQGFSFIMLLGFVLFAGGIAFRLNAIDTLGKFYSHRVRLVEAHSVVDTGPYQWVRHPAYTGMLMAHLGFVLVFFNIYACLALLLVLAPAIVKRIIVEETALFELPGYPQYAECHKRLVPGIW